MSAGASFVDYTANDAAAQRLRDLSSTGFDGVIDLVGGPALRAVAPLARRPAAVVSVGDPTVADLGGAHVERHLDRATLERVADLMVRGQLEPEISATYPFDAAADALATVESGHARGKVVIDVARA